MLSKKATCNSHGQDSSYFLGWQEYEKNPYDPITNPSGIIQMGLAENQDSSHFLGWQENEKNPYDPITNPSGIIQMGLAENQVSTMHYHICVPDLEMEQQALEQLEEKDFISAMAVKECNSCHAIQTPRWRRGPKGPQTLCNACGLRYAKDKKEINKVRLTLGPPTTPSPEGNMLENE